MAVSWEFFNKQLRKHDSGWPWSLVFGQLITVA